MFITTESTRMTKKISFLFAVTVIIQSMTLQSMSRALKCLKVLRNCARGYYALDNPCINCTYTSHNKTLLLNSLNDDELVKIFDVTYNDTNETYSLPLNTENVLNAPQCATVGEGDLQRLYNGYHLPLHVKNEVYYIALYTPTNPSDAYEKRVGIHLGS